MREKRSGWPNINSDDYAHRIVMIGPRTPISPWLRVELMREVNEIISARARYGSVLVMFGDETIGMDQIVHDVVAQEPIRSMVTKVQVRKRYDMYGPLTERLFSQVIQKKGDPTEVFLYYDRAEHSRNKLSLVSSEVFERAGTQTYYIQIDEAHSRITWVNHRIPRRVVSPEAP